VVLKMSQEVFFQNKPSRRARDLRHCSHCETTTEHLKEAGSQEYKCQPCEDRRKREAKRQQGAGI
jgi:hypothetical protein